MELMCIHDFNFEKCKHQLNDKLGFLKRYSHLQIICKISWGIE